MLKGCFINTIQDIYVKATTKMYIWEKINGYNIKLKNTKDCSHIYLIFLKVMANEEDKTKFQM